MKHLTIRAVLFVLCLAAAVAFRTAPTQLRASQWARSRAALVAFTTESWLSSGKAKQTKITYVVSTKLRLSSSSEDAVAPQPSFSLPQLIEPLLPFVEPIAELTRTKLWSFAETVVVIGLLAGIDGGFSGDWSRRGLITTDLEAAIQSTVISVGMFHLFFCAPAAVAAAKVKQHPIAPALLHVLLIGGLGLGKVLCATDETKCTIPTNGEVIYNIKQTLANVVAGKYDIEEVSDRIDADISSSPIFIYTFSTCPSCVKAKKILIDELGMGEYVEIVELDVDKKIGTYPF
jgi:hypothetical protein